MKRLHQRVEVAVEGYARARHDEVGLSIPPGGQVQIYTPDGREVATLNGGRDGLLVRALSYEEKH